MHLRSNSGSVQWRQGCHVFHIPRFDCLFFMSDKKRRKLGQKELAEAELDKAKLAFITEALGASDPFAENLST